MKKFTILVLTGLVFLFGFAGCDFTKVDPYDKFDGICDYCQESESSHWYNEQFPDFFKDKEICEVCWQMQKWLN